MKLKFILYNILIVFVLLSCKNEQVERNEVENNLMEISKEQVLSANMSLGLPIKVAIKEKIFFTGKIVSMQNGAAKISAPVEGIVQEIHIQIGQEINANEVFLEIGGSALIDLQQKFAISAAKIKQLLSNYDRAKSLYNDNIKTENEYLLAESNYKSELANYSALKLKLLKIGLNISNIENGKYAATYCIKSPIYGMVSQINVLTGQYISKEHEIAEIVNKNKVELQLAFFEKDFSKITIGQKVVFSNMDEAKHNTEAVISRKGAKLTERSNTFACYATIDKANMVAFAINQLVSGEVVVASDSVFAVPRSAILSVGNQKNVIVVDSEDENRYYLEKVAVKIGKSDKKYIELIDLPKDKIVLLDGAYNIGME